MLQIQKFSVLIVHSLIVVEASVTSEAGLVKLFSFQDDQITQSSLFIPAMLFSLQSACVSTNIVNE